MGISTSTHSSLPCEMDKTTHTIIIQNLRNIMSEHQRARNNDLFLLFTYWELTGCAKENDEYYMISKRMAFTPMFTQPSSILRARRHLQNTLGELLPTDPYVARRRKIREEQFRKFYAENKELIKQYEEYVYGI